ncbi:MAG: LacI family DNA-binding transcriptional regulator [Armatimonadetes bacterium]|nr:LacI family DNA-binding transcriptional regulator [Armatimonadota bacterium]
MDDKRQVTIREIAERLALSPATISTALTGRRNRVFMGEETRLRILTAAREMGYPVERLRARKRSLDRVALFCFPNKNPIYYGMVLEMSHRFSQQGIYAFVQVNDDCHSEYEAARELYRRHEADGVIFIGSYTYPDTSVLDSLPCVIIGEVPEGVQAWRVNVDNEQGGREVGEHLWSLGHRRVGMLTGGTGLSHSERLQGIRSVWRQRGLDFPDRWLLDAHPDTASNFQEILTAFLQAAARRGEPQTALFCYNDWIAGFALRALHEICLRVPEDISVVGFDDAPYTEMLTPPLTTVYQPFNELGALAAQLLLERLNSPQHPPKSFILRGRLVIRATTGLARADERKEV